MTALDHSDLQRSLGRVEGHQTAMEERMTRLESLVKEGFDEMRAAHVMLHNEIADLKSKEQERQGILKAVAVVATVVGTAVGLIVEWFAHRGHP